MHVPRSLRRAVYRALLPLAARLDATPALRAALAAGSADAASTAQAVLNAVLGQTRAGLYVPPARSLSALAVLRRLVRPGTRVLDIGCNTGELLDFARGLGETTAGVEPSDAGGTIRVRTRLRLGRAVVSIANTVPDGPSRPGTGMALKNVRERLRLMHDLAAQFETRHEKNVFRVQLVVPL